jgi:hypothetical protein
MDELIDNLLRNESYFDITLPRLQVRNSENIIAELGERTWPVDIDLDDAV